MSIRKLNCVALLGICYSIAAGDYERADVSRYERLPENTKNLYDIIISGITLIFENGVAPVVVDIGINTEDSVGPEGVVRQKTEDRRYRRPQQTFVVSIDRCKGEIGRWARDCGGMRSRFEKTAFRTEEYLTH